MNIWSRNVPLQSVRNCLIMPIIIHNVTNYYARTISVLFTMVEPRSDNHFLPVNCQYGRLIHFMVSCEGAVKTSHRTCPVVLIFHRDEI